MTDQLIGRLFGFLCPEGEFRPPGFLIPLFVVDDTVCIQNSKDGLYVSRFEKLNIKAPPEFELFLESIRIERRYILLTMVENGVLMPVSPQELISSHHFTTKGGSAFRSVGIGDPIQFAFAFSQIEIFYGSTSHVQYRLNRRGNLLELPPFVAIEVADFIGDSGMYQQAIADAADSFTFDGESRRHVNAWQQAMLAREIGPNWDGVVG